MIRPTKKIYYVRILKNSFNDNIHIFLSKKEQDKFISKIHNKKSFESGTMIFQKPYYFEEYKWKKKEVKAK